MKLFLLILLSPVISLATSGPKAELLSFKDWKRLEQQKATEQLVALKTKNIKENQEVNIQEQKQKQWNYEVAMDLSLKDYFVLYLSQQPQPLKMSEVASQLSSDEIAEVLQLYMSTLALEPTVVPSQIDASPVAKRGR